MSANAQKIEDKTPEGSATTCVVGCRLPHGLVLQLRMKNGRPDARGTFEPLGRRFTVKGANDSRIVGGAGFTENVPTEFMVEWLKQNAEHPAVVNRNIFMHTDGKSVEAVARETKGQTTGLEAIDPIESARKYGLAVDPESVAAYQRQKAENPERNRQLIVE